MKTILVDAMGTFVIEGQGIYEPLHALLEQYPNPKIILTMAPDDKMVEWGLDKMPYPVFTSRRDPLKADPKFYEQVLEKYGLTKDDVVSFEHTPEAVKSTQSLGIPSHLYDEEKKDLASLKQFLDANL